MGKDASGPSSTSEKEEDRLPGNDSTGVSERENSVSEESEIPDEENDSAEGGSTGKTSGDNDPAKGADRRVVGVAAALLLACGGFVGYGVLNTEDEPEPRAVPTAEVTYEVRGEGTADISYLARSEEGKATAASDVRLPWKKTVQVPLGKDPIVSITLGEEGGEASCTLAIRGEHVQRATAFGSYGRASCTGTLPAPESAGPENGDGGSSAQAR